MMSAFSNVFRNKITSFCLWKRLSNLFSCTVFACSPWDISPHIHTRNRGKGFQFMLTTIWNKLHFGLRTMDDEMLFSQAKFNLRVFRALSTLGSEAISSFSSDFVMHLIMAANHCLRDTGISLHRSLIFLAYYLYLLDLQLTSR